MKRKFPRSMAILLIALLLLPQVVFAGRLRSLSRHQAESLARRLGGTCREVVDEATDYLVLGSEKSPARADGDENDAEMRAREVRDRGKAIRIVNEEEFFGLVISSGAT